jgi:hypothetical protein
MNEQAVSEYLVQFRGTFKSAMRWHHLDELWQVLRESPHGWYVYHVGDEVPQGPLDADRFVHFLEQVDQLLRTDHQEDYCGIVYADNLQAPAMVKIYDPHNLGVSCGYSENPPLPGWVLSRIQPVNLESERILPANRKRWWRRLFS